MSRQKMQSRVLNQDQFVILFCQNLSDGVGDFAHGLDVYEKLRTDPNFKDYKILYININYNKAKEHYLRETLDEKFGNHEDIYLITKSAFDALKIEDDILNEKIKKAQIIFYVSVGRPELSVVRKMKTPVMQVIIGEHAGTNYQVCRYTDPKSKEFPNNIITMGIDNNEAGLLLTNEMHLDEEAKLEVLKSMNISFVTNMLKFSGELTNSNMTEFLQHSFIVPAYLHYGREAMIKGISSNMKILQDNIVFYVNRFDKNQHDIKTEMANIVEYLKPYVTRIDLDLGGVVTNYLNSDKPETNQRSRSVLIMTDYNLSNNDFNSLYKLANLFAGAGGDKTLEKAISHHLIPWYCLPTKDEMHSSLIKLAFEITGSETSDLVKFLKLLPITAGVVYVNYLNTKYIDTAEVNQAIMQLSLLDPKNLQVEWEKMQEHIFQHKNLYDRLPKVFEETLLQVAVLNADKEEIANRFTDAKDINIQTSRLVLYRESHSNLIVTAARTSVDAFNHTLNTYLSIIDNDPILHMKALLKIFKDLTDHQSKTPELRFLYHDISTLQSKFLSIVENLNSEDVINYQEDLRELYEDELCRKFINTQYSGPTSFGVKFYNDEIEKAMSSRVLSEIQSESKPEK